MSACVASAGNSRADTITSSDPTEAAAIATVFAGAGSGVVASVAPAAGLVLYWVVQNLLSILQQWHINRTLEREAKAKARR